MSRTPQGQVHRFSTRPLAVSFGLLVWLTIVGIPLGITSIAFGVKAVSYPRPTGYEIRLYVRRG